MAGLKRNPMDSALPPKKKFLFIMARAPYDGLYAQECMDIILTTAAFEQPVSLLFVDAGIHLLNKGQCAGHISAKHIAPLFQALKIYQINKPWVEEESLRESGMAPEDLLVSVRLLPRSKVADLIEQNDMIYNA